MPYNLRMTTIRWQYILAAKIFGFTLFVFLSACRRPYSNPTVPSAELSVAILLPPTSGECETVRRVKNLFPRARVIEPENAATALSRILEEQTLLIVPQPRSVPQATWNALQRFLDSGGPAVFIGIDPFADRITRTPAGEWIAERDFLLAQMTNAQNAFGVPSVLAWEHRNAAGELQGTVRKAQAPVPNWPAVRVEIDGLQVWDALMITNLPHERSQPRYLSRDRGDRTMAFYARGSEHTFRLFVECQERDSSLWRASVPLERIWKPVMLHEAEFDFVAGPTERGHATDHLSFENLDGIRIGVSATKDLQGTGAQRFEVTDVRWLDDPRDAAQVRNWPDIPLMSPPFRYYSSTARRFRSLIREQLLITENPLTFQSPFPRARSTGGEAAQTSRWIPLFEALDDHDAVLGWPASLHVDIVSNHVARRWAWIGLPDEAPEPFLAASIKSAVQRLHSCIFLHHVGQSTFTVTEGQPVQVTASMTADVPQPADFNIVAELHRADQLIPGRRVSAAASAHTFTRLALGLAPAASPDTEVWKIHFELLDPARRLKYDALDQCISARPRPSTAEDAHRISTSGPNLVFRGRRVYLIGTLYRPHSSIGSSDSEKLGTDWMLPGHFDPSPVERDFDRLIEGGVNSVAIYYSRIEEAAGLKFVIDAAKRRGLWVMLRLPVEWLNPDLSALQDLIKAADLAAEPTVFALDLAGGKLCSTNAPSQLEELWQAWLAEQYGSLEQAEQCLGIAANAESNIGTNGGLSNFEFAVAENPRVAAAFHRFAKDCLSRQYGYLARCLRSWGIKQLLTRSTMFCRSDAILSPLQQVWTDPTAGSLHLDFISPQGTNFDGDDEARAQLAFVTAYCRGIPGGKPVVWMDVGTALPRNPGARELTAQANSFQRFFDAVFIGKSAGVFAREYAGGWRPEENADCGIVGPDGFWRPVVHVYRDFVNRMRRDRGQPEPWRSREINPDEPRRFADLWHSWREIYLNETEAGIVNEVRPTNFGRRTTELTLTTLDGSPLRCQAPILSLNAEWGHIEVDGIQQMRPPHTVLEIKRGSKVRAELLNSGAVLWDASVPDQPQTVWVRISNGGAKTLLPCPLTPPSKSAIVTWIATDAGDWTARPWLADVGEFGEALRIKVH